MQINWKHIILLILAFLFGFFISNKEFSLFEKTPDKIKSDTTSVKTSGEIVDSNKINIPFYVFLDTVITNKVYKSVDTNKIIKDYLEAERTYTVLGNANEVEVKAKPVIFNNRLDSLSFEIKNLRSTEVVYSNDNALGLNTTIGKNIIAPSLMYRHKKWKVGAGYNLINESLLFQVEYEFLQW